MVVVPPRAMGRLLLMAVPLLLLLPLDAMLLVLAMLCEAAT